MLQRSLFIRKYPVKGIHLFFILGFFFPAMVNAEVSPVTVSTTFEGPVIIDLSASITNVSNPDVLISTQPQNGFAEKIPDTSVFIVYTPNRGFSGSDSFNYEVTNDLGQTETATITVHVAPPSDIGNSPQLPAAYAIYAFFDQAIDGSGMANPITGDIDGDNDVDIIGDDNGQLRTLLNNGSGQFSERELTNISSALAVHDMDGDSDLDLVTANLEVWLNNGRGIFAIIQSQLENDGVQHLEFGDMDGDSDTDVVGLTVNGVKLWLNNGTGKLTNGRLISTSLTTAAAIGDLDCDGNLDIFIAVDGVNEIWINDGAGRFSQKTQSFDAIHTSGIQLGDVDGDTDIDAIVTNTTQSQLWLNNGSGEFALESRFDIETIDEHQLELADLNNDGRLDIVGQSVFLLDFQFSKVIFAQLNVGHGVFVPIPHSGYLYPQGFTSLSQLSIDDLNGDNYKDIVVGDPQMSQILFNDMNKRFGIAETRDPASVAIDFDSRIIFALESSGEASIVIQPIPISGINITINYYFTDGSAKFGEDYIASPGTLSWQIGDGSPKTIPITLLADQIEEYPEDLRIHLAVSLDTVYPINLDITPVLIINDKTPPSSATGQCTVDHTKINDDENSGGGSNNWMLLAFLILFYLNKKYKTLETRSSQRL